MPVLYDFHEVKQLLAIEHLHAKVIQDEHVRLRESGKEPVQCAGDACKGNLLEECSRKIFLYTLCISKMASKNSFKKFWLID